MNEKGMNMIPDWILVKDNVYSSHECDELINTYMRNLQTDHDNNYYDYFDIDLQKFNLKKIHQAINDYKEKYNDIDKTASFWGLTELRFKYFKPGKSFEHWHSENSLVYPSRILGIQIYLSDHNCGTEFSSYNKTIKSIKGRMAIFPAYFTHTHRGQVCPENKNRYLITGYVCFMKNANV